MQEVWINARFLTQQISGVQRFAIELSQELKLLYPNINFVAPKNIIHDDIAKKLEVVTIGDRNGQLWEQYDLLKFLKNKNNPLLINLCNSAPIKYRNNIVTLHDLAFIKNPNWFSFYFRIWYRYLIPQICKKAKHIFTVSEFSKNEIETNLDIDSKNITVIYNGLSKELIEHKISKEDININKKFILTVGSINPRKNIKSLITAFNSLNLEDYELLIVGAENANFKDEELPLTNDKVRFLGFVDDQKLWTLYSQAELFVYPSLYEGFGIPVLEALYFECPTIVAPLEVYKEIYGNFDVKLSYTNGHYTENYANSIREKLNEGLNKKQIPQEIINKYSYSESAKKINQIILKLR